MGRCAEWRAVLGADECVLSQYARCSSRNIPHGLGELVWPRRHIWARASRRARGQAWTASRACSHWVSSPGRCTCGCRHAGSSNLRMEHSIAECIGLKQNWLLKWFPHQHTFIYDYHLHNRAPLALKTNIPALVYLLTHPLKSNCFKSVQSQLYVPAWLQDAQIVWFHFQFYRNWLQAPISWRMAADR